MEVGFTSLMLIKRFEGLSLQAYPDPATGGKPWTIGYGHTTDVKPGDLISIR
ncbi:lysozyme, partial [Serratia sp. C2(2)]|nr:lysozyme [Serratia sp. C2(2)]